MITNGRPLFSIPAIEPNGAAAGRQVEGETVVDEILSRDFLRFCSFVVLENVHGIWLESLRLDGQMFLG